jgi:hypothetical protein
MRLNRLLAGLLGLTLLTAGATGCVVRARGGGHVAYVVDTAPPAPRAVYVGVRPGYTYVDGYWYWTGYDWAWQDGYWAAERPGYVYVQGSWVVRGGRHHWQPGYWHQGRARATGHWEHGNGGGYVYKPNSGRVQVREHNNRRGPAKVNVKVKENKRGTTIKVREHR